MLDCPVWLGSSETLSNHPIRIIQLQIWRECVLLLLSKWQSLFSPHAIYNALSNWIAARKTWPFLLNSYSEIEMYVRRISGLKTPKMVVTVFICACSCLHFSKFGHISWIYSNSRKKKWTKLMWKTAHSSLHIWLIIYKNVQLKWNSKEKKIVKITLSISHEFHLNGQ